MNTPFSRAFGRLLQERRIAAGLGQGDVARHLGVQQSAVSKWERGRALPDIQTVLALKDLLGFNLEELRVAS